MTPKEKAIELVNKYWDLNIGWSICCQCALIVVDEILNEYKSYNQSAIIYNDALIYWQEVKQEIENL